MAKLHIDFDRALGRVRPMHGVGQPPLTGIDNRMFHYLKEAGVPYSRPHDAGGDFSEEIAVYRRAIAAEKTKLRQSCEAEAAAMRQLAEMLK